MSDPRVERLARLLVEYSLDLQPGQILRIDGAEVAAPLVVAVYRAALARGAHPYANVELDGLNELLIASGSDDQLEHLSEIEWREVELVDALITIWSEG